MCMRRGIRMYLQPVAKHAVAAALALTLVIACNGPATCQPATAPTIVDDYTATRFADSALADYLAQDYVKAYRKFVDLTTSTSTTDEQKLIAEIGAGDSAYEWCAYSRALKHYMHAANLLDKLEAKPKPPGMPPNLRAEVVCSLGEVLYERQKFEEAQQYFNQAIDLWKEGAAEYDVLLRSLEGMGACFYKNGLYHEALAIYQELAWRDRIAYGADSPPNGWALRILADIYYALKDKKAGDECFVRSAYIFRIYNLDRSLRYWTGKTDFDDKELEARLHERILGQLPYIPPVNHQKQGAFTHMMDMPQPVEDYDKVQRDSRPWRRARVVTFESAGLQWVDPRKQPIGVVVCIPGFGLQHGSFGALGHELADRGYIVISYDVRGFGAYMTLKARDRIDLEKTLDDLDESFARIRADYPGLPVFILGESMGGAVALQFTALHPELVDGLIASVPSSRRYRQLLASGEVALKLITRGKAKINMAPFVVRKATQQQDLRKAWEADPEARLTASARELVAFKKFVDRNPEYARKITKTPVLMFQGLQDLLIRPEGTISLFKEITSKDKDLVLFGNSEHLLLEEGQFNKGILADLLEWMKIHAPEPSPNVQPSEKTD